MMLFNFKVYKANSGNKKAAYLPENKKHIVIDEDILAENGNDARKKFYNHHIDIKQNWQVKQITLSKDFI